MRRKVGFFGPFLEKKLSGASDSVSSFLLVGEFLGTLILPESFLLDGDTLSSPGTFLDGLSIPGGREQEVFWLRNRLTGLLLLT